MLTRPIYHQCGLLGGAVWPLQSRPACQPASQPDSVAEETDASQPPGFISYFHNDISLVTEGQQAWREQRGPYVRAPRGAEGTRGEGHVKQRRTGPPGIRPRRPRCSQPVRLKWAARYLWAVWEPVYGGAWQGTRCRHPLGGEERRGPSGWTTLGKCRLMIRASSVSELHESI